MPVAGTYVFSWSFLADTHGSIYTQLMKNADVIGTRSETVWDFSTGIVVVDVARGDHVYVRLGSDSPEKVGSIAQSRSTFSGWLLN